jgi:hypothetical protein
MEPRVADKEFEPEDPFQPVAVSLDTPGHDGMEAMARCFVEEFALMGWPPARIFRLFTIPEYAASYSVLQDKGEDYVKSIIASVFGEAFEPEDPREAAQLIPVLKRGTIEGEGNGPGL